MRANRAPDEVRSIQIHPGYAHHGSSVIFHMGNTIVHCSASVEEKVPMFVQEGNGWITAEYSMLPSSTNSRARRERGGKLGGRTMEIQRLIGRSLRGHSDLKALGPRAIYLDCDVLRADGGTRCASICGAYLALSLALRTLEKKNQLKAKNVIKSEVAAISLGIVKGQLLLDLQYTEDVRADVDMNLVMTGDGRLIEIQGTAEQEPFTPAQLQEMLALGQKGITDIIQKMQAFLETSDT